MLGLLNLPSGTIVRILFSRRAAWALGRCYRPVWIRAISTKDSRADLSDLPSGSTNASDWCRFCLVRVREESSGVFFPRGRWQSALELPCCACSRVRQPWHVPTSASCSSTRGGSLQLCAVRPDLCCGGAPSFCFCASKPCSLLELPAGLPRRCRRVAARCGVCAPCPGNRAWPSLESLWAAGTWGARSQHRGLKSTPVSGKKEPAESKPRPDATKAATWILSRQAGMRRARWWCPALAGGWDPTTS